MTVIPRALVPIAIAPLALVAAVASQQAPTQNTTTLDVTARPATQETTTPVLYDTLKPVPPPVDFAGRARAAALNAGWAVDGAKALDEHNARAAAEAEAVAAEAARLSGLRQTHANHEDTSPRLGGSSGGGNTSGVNINCESGGNYAYNDGTYFGAYNFDQSTWASAGGSGRPDQASPAEQDAVAAHWVASGHRDAWPNC